MNGGQMTEDAYQSSNHSIDIKEFCKREAAMEMALSMVTTMIMPY